MNTIQDQLHTAGLITRPVHDKAAGRKLGKVNLTRVQQAGGTLTTAQPAMRVQGDKLVPSSLVQTGWRG